MHPASREGADPELLGHHREALTVEIMPLDEAALAVVEAAQRAAEVIGQVAADDLGLRAVVVGDREIVGGFARGEGPGPVAPRLEA